jgi:outer membrane receptor protein involved in Fe transport
MKSLLDKSGSVAPHSAMPRRVVRRAAWGLRACWTYGIVALLACGLSPLHAAAAAAATVDDGTLEEVVVTANKRTENSKEVPVSIGVVEGQALQDLHIEDAEDISRLVPGISFAAHNNGPNGPGQDNITIRGVSSTVGNPTVGTYIDEVPIITITGYEGVAAPRLIDIDRIEVLRGPQGTLYGASSEGGTVRYITNQPDSTAFSGYIREEASDTEHGGFNYDNRAVMNLPVIPGVFALRIAAEYGQDSGYINHYALNGSLVALVDPTSPATPAAPGALLSKGVNSDTNEAVSIKGLWTISDTFTITPAFLFQRLSADDASTFLPSLGLYNQFNQVPGFDHDQLIVPSLTIKAGLGFADLTSVSSFVGRQVLRQADGTYYNTEPIAQYFLDGAGTAPYNQHILQNDAILGNIPSPVDFTDHFSTYTQEFRLASPESDKPFKWVGGVFLSDQKWTHLDYENAPGFSAAFQSIYGYSIDADQVLNPTIGTPHYNANFWANDLVWEVYDHNEVKQTALFGQVDIDLTPKLHLGIGERYVWATESFSEFGGGFFDFGGGGTTGTPYTQSASFSASTPKFTLNYDLSESTTLYTSEGKGFRLGGATTPNTNASCVAGLQQLGDASAPTTYGPDSLWSYEFGSKSLAFGKTLSVNADVYYIDWKNIQQTITIPICGGAFNANVGDATAIGGELEVRYKPPAISGLTLALNAGAEHAYITSTNNASTVQVGENVVYTPKYTGSLLLNYGWHVSDAVGAFVRGDYEYTGQGYGSYIQSTPGSTNPAYIDPSYSIVNLNAGVTVGRFEVSLFAKNLLDNKTILQAPEVDGETFGYTVRPLTVGLTFQAKFP